MQFFPTDSTKTTSTKVIRLKPLLRRLFIATPVHVSPFGYTQVTEPTFWLYRTIAAILRALVGEQISQAHAFGLTHREKIHYYKTSYDQTLENPKTILHLKTWHNPILRSGWKTFQILCTLSALSVFVLGKVIFLFVPLAWGWIGYELTQIELTEIKQQSSQEPAQKNAQKNAQNPYIEAFGLVIGKLMLIAAGSFGLSILFCVLLYWPTFGLSVWMLPFLLTGLFGAIAIMVRVLRSPPNPSHYNSPKHSPIRCQACKLPMKKLSAIQLRQHLTPAQHTEVTLKSNYYEGWQCQHCVPFTHPQDFKIHLAAYALNQQDNEKCDYEKCQKCQTLTVNVTRQVLETATKSRTGRVLEKKYCHYCHTRSTAEIILPVRRRY